MRNSEALKKAAGDLTTAGVASPRLDAEILLAHILGLERTDLLGRWGDVLNPRQIDKFESLIARRKKREPVARITGIQEFWSLPFLVNDSTLLPRPDSEILVEVVIKKAKALRKKNLKILDFGTGSGCLLLAILSELPKATGIGLDIKKEAITCARENAQSLGLEDRTEFKKFNWNGYSPISLGFYDILISNPPYIETAEIKNLAPEVRKFEPFVALDGGKDGLKHYQEILYMATGPLNPKGCFAAFEVGEGQAESVGNLLKNKGFFDIVVYKDLNQIDRVVTGKHPGH